MTQQNNPILNNVASSDIAISKQFQKIRESFDVADGFRRTQYLIDNSANLHNILDFAMLQALQRATLNEEKMSVIVDKFLSNAVEHLRNYSEQLIKDIENNLK